VVFGYQHLAGVPRMTRELAARRGSAIAFELVRDAHGQFPLLAPMSRLAGRMAVEAAARHLGTAPARVLVLGGGHAGQAAAAAARDAGAQVWLLTRSAATREAAERALGSTVECGYAERDAIERRALEADLVVGAVFIPGTPTPKLLPRALVARMRRGAMIADISIDAGGVAETSRPTTHGEPTFVAEGVVHYCVPNIPAADPVASVRALGEALLPFVRRLAGRGFEAAFASDAALAAGLCCGAAVRATRGSRAKPACPTLTHSPPGTHERPARRAHRRAPAADPVHQVRLRWLPPVRRGDRVGSGRHRPVPAGR
jgi:alanine dehydrogenase